MALHMRINWNQSSLIVIRNNRGGIESVFIIMNEFYNNFEIEHITMKSSYTSHTI